MCLKVQYAKLYVVKKSFNTVRKTFTTSWEKELSHILSMHGLQIHFGVLWMQAIYHQIHFILVCKSTSLVHQIIEISLHK